MPKYSVVWSKEAQERLDEIHFYISNTAKSDIPADKFILKLIDRTILLATFPFSGQAEPHFAVAGKERRYLVEGDYKIIYRIVEDKVIITDIFHTSLNPQRLTKRDKNE